MDPLVYFVLDYYFLIQLKFFNTFFYAKLLIFNKLKIRFVVKTRFNVVLLMEIFVD